jgi:uncharacterized protein (DUF885 family)
MPRPLHVWALPLAALIPAACAGLPEAGAPASVAARPAQVDVAAFFEAFDAAELALSPTAKTVRGIRDRDYGRWGDLGDRGVAARAELFRSTGEAMRRGYDPARLPADQALSVRLLHSRFRRAAGYFKHQGLRYVFSQQQGSPHYGLPATLIGQHAILTEQHAADYVSRIGGLGPALDTLLADSKRRADAGVMPPRWVYDNMIPGIEAMIRPGAANPVLDDFAAKLARLELAPARKRELIAEAELAWTRSAAPAYARLLAEMKRQRPLAGTEDGVWRFPGGAEYYDAMLAFHTTTSLTADEIHALGLSEVARIHDEMRSIMLKVGFKGDLRAFFDHTRDDPRFQHPTREAYLADAGARLAAMEAALPRYFHSLPRDRLEVRPVEAFREKTATKAFYSPPAPDGSRPGIYYVNLSDLKAMSRNEVEALAFHEGVPGHHLERSISFGLTGLPAFRRFAPVTAYSEGWGLYAERLGKDMGFYTDPYSDFGRLGMEILRAGRLVADTGIHAKRWSREQAVAWFIANTPATLGDIQNQVERYVVDPGQATAYTIGKLKIEELRARAQARLGDRFDIRDFHDVVLKSGPVPLDILEENVDSWIVRRAAPTG